MNPKCVITKKSRGPVIEIVRQFLVIENQWFSPQISLPHLQRTQELRHELGQVPQQDLLKQHCGSWVVPFHLIHRGPPEPVHHTVALCHRLRTALPEAAMHQGDLALVEFEFVVRWSKQVGKSWDPSKIDSPRKQPNFWALHLCFQTSLSYKRSQRKPEMPAGL